MAVCLTCVVGVGLLGLLGTGVGVAADKPVTLRFWNDSSGNAELFWLDSGKGKEVSFGVVPQGKTKTLETSHGHVWIVRGAKGEEVDRITVDSPDGAGVAFGIGGMGRAYLDVLKSGPVKVDTKKELLRAANERAKEVLRFVNEERKQKGLAALVEDPALTSAAQKYARFMAQRHFDLIFPARGLSDRDARDRTLSHKLDGNEPFQRAKAEGFPHEIVFEVVKAGPNSVNPKRDVWGPINAEQAVRAPDGVGWISSKAGDREAILSSKCTLAGVGIAFTPSAVTYYVMKLAAPR
jgi:uncharacterized protein YkwD